MRDKLVNALIRCRRNDNLAGPELELVREDIGLWVRELPYSMTGSADVSVAMITQDLLEITSSLKQLASGSEDYSLHLAYVPDDCGRLVLPPQLCSLATECGFAIELIVSSED